MSTTQHKHYCSYCLRPVDAGDDFCPTSSCGRTRPPGGWARYLEAGESIDGRYRIRSRLGSGGAGVTYRAIDFVADDEELRDVALKVLHRDRSQGILRDRLRLEGEVLRRLEHPHVVAFRDLKVDGGGEYYLATGFMPGGSLDEPMRKAGRLPARTVLVVGAQIARALAAAHAIGVTHRDLKPSNIMVRNLDEYPLHVRVGDWGIARAVPEFVPRRHVTLQGGFVGTPEFASPEQLRGEPTVGPPTDIFGLGVLMHTLAGGQPLRDLVARGAVDFQALKEGASRYERVPLTPGGSYETHLPLLDELVDQLITRAPETRPDAETVAAYCEELLEAGDTTPSKGRSEVPLPALMPAAAFDSPPKEPLLLPEDSRPPRPLRLSDEEPESPRVNTVEMDPADVSAGAPSDSGPITPTAVPEDLASVPGVEVLAEAQPTPPEDTPAPPHVIGEPTPWETTRSRQLRSIAPIRERDDEPVVGGGRIVIGLLGMLALIASLGVLGVLAVSPVLRGELIGAFVALAGDEAETVGAADASDPGLDGQRGDRDRKGRRLGLWERRAGSPSPWPESYRARRHSEFQRAPGALASSLAPILDDPPPVQDRPRQPRRDPPPRDPPPRDPPPGPEGPAADPATERADESGAAAGEPPASSSDSSGTAGGTRTFGKYSEEAEPTPAEGADPEEPVAADDELPTPPPDDDPTVRKRHNRSSGVPSSGRPQRR